MSILHHEQTLDLNADSAEWCPTTGSKDCLAVGTYQLDESNNQRDGRLYLFVASKHEADPQQGWQLQRQAWRDCSGIFDMRWAPHTSAPVLALALANGSVQLLQPTVEGWHPVAAADVGQGMVLTVDWARHQARQGRTAASTSTGHLALMQVQQQAAEGALKEVLLWQGHDLEAWTIAADCWQPDILFSGSDDCSLKGWDVRQPPEAPIFVDRRTHGAGVCCVQSSPAVEHLLVTGSYDEQVRTWDLRMMHRPTCSNQVGTGGGVWRLKWHPYDPRLLLAACMHNGFAVLQLSELATTSDVRLAEEYPNQKTLGYGADWCHLEDAGRRSLIATCSFYDRLLHMWQPATVYNCS